MSSQPQHATFLIVLGHSKSLNPNGPFTASHGQTSMNKLTLLCICSIALAGNLRAQVSTETPITTPTAAAATTATSTATPTFTITAAPSPTANSDPSDLADKIHRKLEKKLGGRHGIVIDSGGKDGDADLEQIRNLVAIPIVAIVFMSIFGAPVLIVMVIGIFALIGNRMRQRTIRMMVEKGQPVPAELLAPEVRRVRRRSDVRRGVVWSMVGLGLMIWLAAVNDWQGGVWSFGLIPFLIGLGYLIIWKLENKKDIPPPAPRP
jgi:hypothetical protein